MYGESLFIDRKIISERTNLLETLDSKLFKRIHSLSCLKNSLVTSLHTFTRILILFSGYFSKDTEITFMSDCTNQGLKLALAFVLTCKLPSLEFEPSKLKEVYYALLFMKVKYKSREETRSSNPSNPHLESLEKLDDDDKWKWVKDDKRTFSCKYYFLKVFTR